MSIYKLLLLVVLGLFVSACTQQEFTKGENTEGLFLSDLENQPNPEGAIEAAKGCICHIPPGNPANAHTICVGRPAIPHHIDHHGDYLGECRPVVLPPVLERPPTHMPGPPPIEDPGPQVM